MEDLRSSYSTALASVSFMPPKFRFFTISTLPLNCRRLPAINTNIRVKLWSSYRLGSKPNNNISMKTFMELFLYSSRVYTTATTSHKLLSLPFTLKSHQPVGENWHMREKHKGVLLDTMQRRYISQLVWRRYSSRYYVPIGYIEPTLLIYWIFSRSHFR